MRSLNSGRRIVPRTADDVSRFSSQARTQRPPDRTAGSPSIGGPSIMRYPNTPCRFGAVLRRGGTSAERRFGVTLGVIRSAPRPSFFAIVRAVCPGSEAALAVAARRVLLRGRLDHLELSHHGVVLVVEHVAMHHVEPG